MLRLRGDGGAIGGLQLGLEVGCLPVSFTVLSPSSCERQTCSSVVEVFVDELSTRQHTCILPLINSRNSHRWPAFPGR